MVDCSTSMENTGERQLTRRAVCPILVLEKVKSCRTGHRGSVSPVSAHSDTDCRELNAEIAIISVEV